MFGFEILELLKKSQDDWAFHIKAGNQFNKYILF